MPTNLGSPLIVAAADSPAMVKAQADAVCDGVNDSAIIKAQWDKLESSTYPGATLVCMQGTYAFKTTLVLDGDYRNFVMLGSIQCTNCDGIYIAGNYGNHYICRLFGDRTNGKDGVVAPGTDKLHASQWFLDFVTIAHARYGIYLRDPGTSGHCINSHIRGRSVYSCTIGIYLSSANVDAHVMGNILDIGCIEHCYGTCLYIEGSYCGYTNFRGAIEAYDNYQDIYSSGAGQNVFIMGTMLYGNKPFDPYAETHVPSVFCANDTVIAKDRTMLPDLFVQRQTSFQNLLRNPDMALSTLDPDIPDFYDIAGTNNVHAMATGVSEGAVSNKLWSLMNGSGYSLYVGQYLFRQIELDYCSLKRMVAGAWVKCTEPGRVTMAIVDHTAAGSEYARGPFHTGSGWELLVASKTIRNAIDERVRIHLEVSAGDSIYLYVSWMYLGFGENVPAPAPVLPNGSEPAYECHIVNDTLDVFSDPKIVHSNQNASNPVVLALPQTESGLTPALVPGGTSYEFVCMASERFELEPGVAGGIYLGGVLGTDNYYIWSDTPGSSLKLVSDGDGNWIAMNVVGTWGFYTP